MSSTRRTSPAAWRSIGALRQAGFTLVELMVAILIGFAVVGALLAAYMASYRSTLHNDALSQVTEDATLALSAIRAQAAMAGYSQVTTNPTTQTLQKRPGFVWLFGCSQSNFVGPPYLGIQTSVPCTGTSASDTLEVAYEANDSTYAGGSSNAILSATGQPLDCLGNPIGRNGGYFLADSKFYVSDGKLYCQGAGNVTQGQPLVDNVEKMTVRFGYSNAIANYDGVSARIVAYLPAPPGTNAQDIVWQNFAAVTVCIQVHSTSIAVEPNGDASNPLANFIDCNGNQQQKNDGLLRRTFSTTIVFQNKLI
jgi:type IV pilus assembly protein PilW